MKLNKKSISYWIIAASGILSMNPYFVWPTFMNGILAYGVYGCYILSSMLIFSQYKKKFILSRKMFFGLILLVVLYSSTYIMGAGDLNLKKSLGAMLSFINMFAIVSMDLESQKEVFDRFVRLFIITLIPGVIYYILELAGISLSIGTLYSSNQMAYLSSAENTSGNAGYYKLYIGSVLRVSYNMRFSGIYDEAGLVGTVSSLLLAAKGYRFKNDKQCVFLLFFAIISFSFAGYLLILGYWFLKWAKTGKWKLCMVMVIGVLALYVFLHVEFDNILIKSIQDRFAITETGIKVISNRETSTFKKGYSLFLNSDLFTRLFGFGSGAANNNAYLVGSSTYKFTIYDYGYIGFAFRMFVIFYFIPKIIKIHPIKYWNATVLIVLFYLSIYQRPGVFYAYYFIILFCGISNIIAGQKWYEEMQIQYTHE